MGLKKLNNLLPQDVHKDILFLLSKEAWRIANDNSTHEDILNFDNHQGFSIETFNVEEEKYLKTSLNWYAELILKLILNKLNTKGRLLRVFFNMYHQNHAGEEHVDSNKPFKSVLYCLHTNDGYFEHQGIKYPDIEGQVLIFNSNELHRGVGPTKSKVRFNLNLVFEEI